MELMQVNPSKECIFSDFCDNRHFHVIILKNFWFMIHMDSWFWWFWTESVGPVLFSAEYLICRHVRTDRQTDGQINLGGLGNLRFLQVNNIDSRLLLTHPTCTNMHSNTLPQSKPFYNQFAVGWLRHTRQGIYIRIATIDEDTVCKTNDIPNQAAPLVTDSSGKSDSKSKMEDAVAGVTELDSWAVWHKGSHASVEILVDTSAGGTVSCRCCNAFTLEEVPKLLLRSSTLSKSPSSVLPTSSAAALLGRATDRRGVDVDDRFHPNILCITTHEDCLRH